MTLLVQQLRAVVLSWMFKSSDPMARSWATLTGRPLMRQTLRPSALMSRCKRRLPSSSGAMPFS